MSEDQVQIEAVEAVLADFPDPETGRGLKTLDQVRDVQIDGNAVGVTIALTSYAAPLWKQTGEALADRLRVKLPGAEVSVEVVEHDRPAEPIGNIGLTAKSVIAVGSGKGGVGKSTVAASIAYGLKNAGCKVGLMDADVYGPSIPHLLGVPEGKPVAEEKRLQPVQADGMPVMSMGFLVPPGEAVVWRGPMLHGAVTQFLRDTDWGDLDYLLIDMPPGTGDIALTLSQLLPLTGAVVVCTPQEVALLDAVKAIAMFRKVNIPVLGMVENMSYFLCPDNGKQYDIFGSGGARTKAEELDVPFLGEVPIQLPIRERGDQGATAGNLTDAQSAAYYERICFNLVNNLAKTRADSPPMPSLSVL